VIASARELFNGREISFAADTAALRIDSPLQAVTPKHSLTSMIALLITTATLADSRWKNAQKVRIGIKCMWKKNLFLNENFAFA